MIIRRLALGCSPPPADRVDGKARRVVVGADADPSGIVGDVVDPVRHGTLQFGIDKVMNVDGLGRAFRPPFPPVVLEITHQFLLFRVNRYDRFVRGQVRLGLRVDVLKLPVAVDVLVAFSCLAVRLQAIAHATKKIADNRRANLVPLLRKRIHEVTQAACRPQQRLHRVAPRHRLDQALEIAHKGCILGCFRLAPTPGPADTSRRSRHLVSNVANTVINRRSRQSADPGHQTDPAASQRMRFQADKPPSALFIQNRCHLPIALPYAARICRSNHPTTLRRWIPPCESRSINSS